MPRQRSLAFLVASICFALGFSIQCAVAQIQPANPSFSNPDDQDLLAHDFGTFRQGAPGATFNVTVTNLPASTGTTSAMSLKSVATLGDSTSMVLQTGTVNGVAAGSNVVMPLALNTTTSKYGNLQVSYVIGFTSDAIANSPVQQLVVTAYAKVLPSGDYNNDGKVDAADYVIWRNTQGHSVAVGTGADGDFNGVVNLADYTVWRSNFGQQLASAAGLSNGSSSLLDNSSVPEPSTIAFVLMCVTVWPIRTRSRRFGAIGY